MLGDLDGIIKRSKKWFEPANMKDRLSVENDMLDRDVVLGLADDLVGAEPVGTEFGRKVIGGLLAGVEKNQITRYVG
jgi:hypothetical protein